METVSCVKAVVMGYHQYKNNPNDTNLVQLQRHLEVLISVTTSASSLTTFSPKDLLVMEFLTCLMDILNDAQTKPSLVQKTLLLLRNLANSAVLCEMLHATFDLTPCLAVYLKSQVTALPDPDILLCIKLLQKVTYNQKVMYQSCVEDLLQFLIKQIQSKESELTEWCLGLLANLCRHNLPVQLYVKNQENVKLMYKKLIHHVSGGPEIRIYALCILTSLCLLEDIGQRLFRAENIHQTFQMMFNILINEESALSLSYAVDLFTDLVSNTKIQDTLATYSYLKPCLSQVLELLSGTDQEEVAKIFELLLAFCSVNSLRHSVCARVVESKTSSQGQPVDHLRTITHWAAHSVEPQQTVSLLALQFLTEVYQEMLDQGQLSAVSSHTSDVLAVMTEILMCPWDVPSAASTKTRCLKVVRALKLLCTLCTDDTLRVHVADAVDPKTCLQLLNHQLDNNAIALRCSGSAQSELQDWSEAGTDVVLHTLDLMSVLKVRQRSKGRKSTMDAMNSHFVQVLQDSRLVPFLAYGLTSEGRERVQKSLHLISIGSTLEDFQTIILGDSIAACNCASRSQQQKLLSAEMTLPVSNQAPPLGPRIVDKENMPFQSNKTTFSEDLENSVQCLIDKMQTGLELNDMKGSEIISVYEHRLQSLETKENHLQDLLEAKALALSQADRLIAQYRCRKAQSDAEAGKMRSLVQESERRSEDYREKLNDMQLERENMQIDLERLGQENARLEAVAVDHQELTQAYAEQSQRLENAQRTLSTLKQEHQTMSEMHEMLRRHNETLKQQHDVASQQLAELEDERKNLSRQLKDREGKVTELGRSLKKTEDKLKKTTKERDELETAIDNFRQNLSQTEQTKKELQHQVSTLELVCRQHETSLKHKDAKIIEYKTELDKHTQIAALIHNLSSGKNPGDIKM